jgi:hypothetical protein
MNLAKVKVQSWASEEISINTDPYCPTVGAIPSHDAPLEIKSGEEFPTERWKVELR